MVEATADVNTPPVRSDSYRGPDWVHTLVARYDMPPIMVRVAYCESAKAYGGDWSQAVTAISPTHDYGLWQINRKTWHDEVEDRWPDLPFEQSMLIPERNAEWAKKLVGNGEGLRNWGTQNSVGDWGSYKCWGPYA